ncbi:MULTISPECIES: YchJ family protein [unclassified Halomonas]|uniref:YchJ family protein n=2 Tax=Halomonadaceae TaxID=28256 RepID=UPI001C979FAA|nr:MULTISPECIES: YchJ family metal-binding protein [unclassified Halomonas]MBY5927308.1 SEC-C domain-containing protein [Halomonas sp. DP4Y7-2]MBY5929311.1 SEC-C domain-containing protein [Halomonas sp. DP8Y7-3]MBY6234349.1 SEC-C domain-containing protein [Halomonas sp. DP4Y7-1]
MATSNASACPCGSGLALADCCQPLHQGGTATSPEALMRSRYSAFSLGLDDYLRHSWHPDCCPQEMGTSDTCWKRLEVLDSGEEGDAGWVHFRATFADGPRARQRWGVLEERSRFVRYQQRWVYLDGEPSVTRLKPGRNDSCPCGSGRKFKQCCA